jgi:hypothetical protein
MNERWHVPSKRQQITLGHMPEEVNFNIYYDLKCSQYLVRQTKAIWSEFVSSPIESQQQCNIKLDKSYAERQWKFEIGVFEQCQKS